MMFLSEREVKRIREMYPAGTRIQVDGMNNDPRPILPGTNGTVKEVDDIGTVHCVFDNGRSLGLIPGEDSFHVLLVEKEVREILNGIDENRDAFWVFPEEGEVIEIYYNPDSDVGGQFVFNYMSFDLVLDAEKECDGDAGQFFDCMQDRCYQEMVDIDDTVDSVRSAAEELMAPADLVGCNKDSMEKLINAAHAYKEREQQNHKNNHER